MGNRGTRGLVIYLPIAVLLMALLGGCETAPTLRLSDVPPVTAGAARLFFYRDLNPYDPTDWTPVSLNGKPVGESRPGTAFYRDVAPGTYEITVRSEGLYPNQFKTVAVESGNTVFAKIQALRRCDESVSTSTEVTFVVTIVDPAVAQGEIGRLRLLAGRAPMMARSPP